MNEKFVVENHEGGTVRALTQEQMNNEHSEAAEAGRADAAYEGNSVSFLTNPELIRERLDAINTKLADNAIEENKLLAEQEQLTIQLNNLEAQKN